jgi:hypothetical protein
LGYFQYIYFRSFRDNVDAIIFQIRYENLAVSVDFGGYSKSNRRNFIDQITRLQYSVRRPQKTIKNLLTKKGIELFYVVVTDSGVKLTEDANEVE